MVVHAFNLSTPEAEARRVQEQPALQTESRSASQDYRTHVLKRRERGGRKRKRTR